MTSKIEITELKNRASEIDKRAERLEALGKLEDLARSVTNGWVVEGSVLGLLEEQRRSLYRSSMGPDS